jgi:hypothetical protein
MYKIVLLRHGESIWNQENRFTGWTDVDLNEKGLKEVQAAGRLLKQEGFAFDVAFTSVLRRAIKTLWIVLEEMDRMWIPVHHSWRLNERHYGALQGLTGFPDRGRRRAPRSGGPAGRSGVVVRSHDLAAPDGPRHACGTALSGATDPGRALVSSLVTSARKRKLYQTDWSF